MDIKTELSGRYLHIYEFINWLFGEMMYPEGDGGLRM
jgi:hypothetical protein